LNTIFFLVMALPVYGIGRKVKVLSLF